jgi:hypothetical protein
MIAALGTEQLSSRGCALGVGMLGSAAQRGIGCESALVPDRAVTPQKVGPTNQWGRRHVGGWGVLTVYRLGTERTTLERESA